MAVHLASRLAERDTKKPVKTKSFTRHVWASEEAEGGGREGENEGGKERRREEMSKGGEDERREGKIWRT